MKIYNNLKKYLVQKSRESMLNAKRKFADVECDQYWRPNKLCNRINIETGRIRSLYLSKFINEKELYMITHKLMVDSFYGTVSESAREYIINSCNKHNLTLFKLYNLYKKEITSIEKPNLDRIRVLCITIEILYRDLKNQRDNK